MDRRPGALVVAVRAARRGDVPARRGQPARARHPAGDRPAAARPPGPAARDRARPAAAAGGRRTRLRPRARPEPAPVTAPPTAIAATPPPPWTEAVEHLRTDLADTPFTPPSAERLEELGLTGDLLAAADRAAAVLVIDDDIVLLPGADREALRVLNGLPQPFTRAQAAAALGTSRDVAVALLRHLDRLGLTERRSSNGDEPVQDGKTG